MKNNNKKKWNKIFTVRFMKKNNFKKKKYIYQEKDFKIGNERKFLENKWIKKITKIRNSTKIFKSTFYHKMFFKRRNGTTI